MTAYQDQDGTVESLATRCLSASCCINDCRGYSMAMNVVLNLIDGYECSREELRVKTAGGRKCNNVESVSNPLNSRVLLHEFAGTIAWL